MNDEKAIEQLEEFLVIDDWSAVYMPYLQDAIEYVINRMKTLEERPQGEWIAHSSENLLWGHNECPFCHKRSNRDASYCQYCGADMRGEEE